MALRPLAIALLAGALALGACSEKPATPADLIGAASANDTAAVKRMLARGADPNAADVHGQTPLFFAVYNKNLEAAEVLVKARANPNARTKAGEFALLRAVLWGQAPMVELLIKAGADVNMKPTDPRVAPPLALARQAQMSDIVELLTRAGAKD